MLLKAKNAAPQPGFSELISPVFGQIFNHSSTLIAVPEGYLLTDTLASVLVEKGLEVVWICFGPEDRDPGILLLSLVNGFEKVLPGIRDVILSKMRRQPGPVTGWEPFFAFIAAEINLNTTGLVIILEGTENFRHSHICSRLIFAYFLENLAPKSRSVLISSGNLPKSTAFSPSFLIRPEDLRVNESVSSRIVGSSNMDISSSGARRAVQLARGKLAVLVSLMESIKYLNPEVIDRQLIHSSSLEDLLSRISGLVIMKKEESAVQSLAMSLSLGYSHATIRSIAQLLYEIPTPAGNYGLQVFPPYRKSLPDSEMDLWHQPLENGWVRLRGYWRQPLRINLKNENDPKSEFVGETAAFLLEEKAICAAVNLCFKHQSTTLAAEIISHSAAEMLDLGQWATLASWIEHLEPEASDAWPILAYVNGKILTASGHMDHARKAFARSSQLYARAHDPDGECRSLQAESILAAWHGETTFSRERALSAYALAQRSRLNWHEIWASWHLGAMAFARQDYIEALERFKSAANLAKSSGYQSVWAMIEQAAVSLQRQYELEHELFSHRQSLLAAEKAMKENQASLQNLTNSPFENLDELLEEHGWMNLPVMPITSAWVEPIKSSKLDWNLFHQINAIIRPVWENLPAGTVPSSISPWNWTPDVGTFPQSAVLDPQDRLSRSSEVVQPDVEQLSDHSQANELKVWLLGDFRVEIAGRRLDGWTHNRVCALFKYLLVHRDHYTPRELLMETFWPDSTPEAARNSMNVTLHNLRYILCFPDVNHPILFHEGGYRLNPAIDVWVDLDEFEMLIQKGRQLDAAGQNAESIQMSEAAVALYHGDFLSEDLYDEWPVTQRERLRTLFLDALDRLSQQYFAQENFHTCLQLCQRILERDICREDVHRRIMRCHSRLGQDCLAIRQYQICVQALQSELEVEPESNTRQLYERIRRREKV